MNLPQRAILLLTALVILWLCLCTPRTITYRDGRDTITLQSGHHWFNERYWSSYPTDYARLVLELGCTVVIGGIAVLMMGRRGR